MKEFKLEGFDFLEDLFLDLEYNNISFKGCQYLSLAI